MIKANNHFRSQELESRLQAVKFFPDDFFEPQPIQSQRPDTYCHKFSPVSFRSVTGSEHESIQRSVGKNLRHVLINKNFRILKRSPPDPVSAFSVSTERTVLPNIKAGPTLCKIKESCEPKAVMQRAVFSKRLKSVPDSGVCKIGLRKLEKLLLKPLAVLDQSNDTNSSVNESMEKVATRTGFFASCIQNPLKPKETKPIQSIELVTKKNRLAALQKAKGKIRTQRDLNGTKGRRVIRIKEDSNKENKTPNVKQDPIPNFTFGNRMQYINI